MGLGLPLLVAVFAIPSLLERLGSERFGFLALAWGLIGYAGALDLGIGRATTQRVSALRSGENDDQIPDVVATAIRVTSRTGGIGMLLIVVAALAGAYRFVHAATVPVNEIELSMFLLALALPMQSISATYRGVNEAYLNFRGINILRILLGVANFGVPYLVSIYTQKVYWLVATLVFSRFLALMFYRHLAHQCMADGMHVQKGKYVRRHARDLLRFGGWFTVTGVVGPIMVQADRFFVGVLISAAAVTLYVIPYEVAIQASILVGAITTVIFPVITNLLHGSPQEAELEFKRWLGRVAGAMFPLMALLAYSMPFLLHLWVGERITEESILAGQILCAGVFLNAIGSMYFSLLHAQGFVKQTAILHLAELPIYIVLLLALIASYGIVGCAIAWVVRTAIDTAALFWISNRTRHEKVLAP